MSSRHRGAGLCRGQMVLEHAAIDLIRDASTERSDGFLLGVAGSPSMLDVDAGCPSPSNPFCHRMVKGCRGNPARSLSVLQVDVTERSGRPRHLLGLRLTVVLRGVGPSG